MKTLGYYNGKYGELDEMTIPMNDRVSSVSYTHLDVYKRQILYRSRMQ